MDENNTSSLMKLTLYDRIFKPQTVTLSNGHSVQRRRFLLCPDGFQKKIRDSLVLVDTFRRLDARSVDV